MADRYTYVPSIGISIMAVWGVSDALESIDTVRSFFPDYHIRDRGVFCFDLFQAG
jgi:hypothetical protein